MGVQNSHVLSILREGIKKQKLLYYVNGFKEVHHADRSPNKKLKSAVHDRAYRCAALDGITGISKEAV